MQIWIRRGVLAVGSTVVAYFLTRFAVVPFLGTTPEEYAWGPEVIPIPYFFLTVMFLAITLALIADKWTGTELLPE